MLIEKKAKNLDLSPEVKEYIDKKIKSLSNVLKSFKEPLKGWIEVEKMSVQEEPFRAEFQIIWQDYSLRGEDRGESVFGALDKARDKIFRELVKLKTKVEKKDKSKIRDFKLKG